MTTLQNYLEDYLKDEGLYDVIPEHKRPDLFPFPISITALIWIVSSFGPAVFFMATEKGLLGIFVTVLAIIGLLCVIPIVFLIAFIFFQIRLMRAGKANFYTILGGIIFLVPIVYAVILGIYLGSWQNFVLFIVTYICGFVILTFLNLQSYRLHLFFELFRSVFGALRQSISLLVSLIPLFLVIVLFSVFTRDLWELLAQLSDFQFFIGVLWLAIPAFVFVVISGRREILSIVGNFPDNITLIERAETTEFIKSKLENGFISQEEWDKLKEDINWRMPTKLAEQLFPIIQKKVGRWLSLLLVFVGISLTFGFFVYFFILFTVLFSPSQIADWTQTLLTSMPVSINIFGQSWNLILPNTIIVTAKGSLFLAFFVSITASISGLNDDGVRKIIMDWLTKKAASWMAISALYTCQISPDYYIWQYQVDDKHQGIANVIVVVKPNLSLQEIKQVCEYIENLLDDYKRFVMLTAFEQADYDHNYRIDSSKKCWRLLHNKTTNVREFNEITEHNELRYSHFLGREALKIEGSISEEWFGNFPDVINFSKKLWNDDIDHEWVLHPYVSKSSEMISIEINLAKRKATSKQYHLYVKEIARLARQFFPEIGHIMVELYYRDTTDILAMATWNNKLPEIIYKDETMKNIRRERPKDWG